ncbi:MAG: DEAD/DEAH box helicase [Clostridia bacterium]|nr:DEAD/DEAH box helicase [Clostridia bacterium]
MNLEQVRQLFFPYDYSAGMQYYREGRVQGMDISTDGAAREVVCTVQGTRRYVVNFRLVNDEVHDTDCNCERFWRCGICKHVAAAMICYVQNFDPSSGETNIYAKLLLDSYVQKTQKQQDAPRELAHLVPQLSIISGSYPRLTFRVGYQKLYVVRSILAFLHSVRDGKTESYGKGLTLNHSIEQFDSVSQELIQLLMNEFPQFRTQNGYAYSGYEVYNRNRGEIIIAGDAFDRLFDILKSQPEEYRNQSPIVLKEEDPKVTVKITKKDQGALLSIITPENYTFFGSSRTFYAARDHALLRCSGAFREKVYPLLKQGQKAIYLSRENLPTFCGCVLPEIIDQVPIEDEEAILQNYLPDECIARFYFDLQDDVLTMKILFAYGDKTYAAESDGKKNDPVRRNVKQEASVVYFAEQVFRRNGQNGFELTGEDAVYDFLTEGIHRFRERGEIYFSDRLQNKRMAPAPAKVGVSVSDGLLSLSLDTGGFPPEELQALYQSMLLRRKYHRLTDGRYMQLNGSSCEKLAEITQMLQLSEKDLLGGNITMPACRGLYLDTVLTGSEGIQVRRDTHFRAMIRNFKTLAESDYAVPKELTAELRPYQLTGYQWLKTLESYGFGGILADEMGLGKTLQMIAYLVTVPNRQVGMPNLVVCPASLLYNWGDEMQKFAPNLQYTLILGSAAERKNLRSRSANADVWVTSYELLRQDIEDYASMQFYTCVLDEAQHIKNSTTLVSKSVKRIVSRQRFILTGTPIENRLSELWNLFDFMMPGYLFTHHAFVEKLEKPMIKSKNAEAMSQLRRLVQPFMLRRLKADVLKELPEKQEYVHRICLTEEEKKLYYANVQATLADIDHGEDKLQILAALTRLRQVCCDPNLCYENYRGATSKLDACVELCEAMATNGHQILLFSQFTSMLDRLRERLDAMHITNFTLQGSTSKEKRASLVKAFNAGEASVFLISLKAGGTGLNLTAADVVIHFDPWWNQAAQDQATDRAHRIGQMAHVQVYKLIAKDTIEEKILELQEQKRALLDSVSGGEEGSIMRMSAEELMELLKI